MRYWRALRWRVMPHFEGMDSKFYLAVAAGLFLPALCGLIHIIRHIVLMRGCLKCREEKHPECKLSDCIRDPNGRAHCIIRNTLTAEEREELKKKIEELDRCSGKE